MAFIDVAKVLPTNPLTRTRSLIRTPLPASPRKMRKACAVSKFQTSNKLSRSADILSKARIGSSSAEKKTSLSSVLCAVQANNPLSCHLSLKIAPRPRSACRACRSTLSHQSLGTGSYRSPLHSSSIRGGLEGSPGIFNVPTNNLCVPCSLVQRVSTSSPSVTHACGYVYLSKLGGTIVCTSLYFTSHRMVTSALALSTALNCFSAHVTFGVGCVQLVLPPAIPSLFPFVTLVMIFNAQIQLTHSLTI